MTIAYSILITIPLIYGATRLVQWYVTKDKHITVICCTKCYKHVSSKPVVVMYSHCGDCYKP